MHFSITNERIRARFDRKNTKKNLIKCNQMKKRQEYERKLTQIIPAKRDKYLFHVWAV